MLHVELSNTTLEDLDVSAGVSSEAGLGQTDRSITHLRQSLSYEQTGGYPRQKRLHDSLSYLCVHFLSVTGRLISYALEVENLNR